MTIAGVCSLAAFAAGCSSEGGASSSGTSGFVLPDGGSLDGARPDGGAACPPAPTVVLEAKARKLALAGDRLVFLDRNAGPEFYPGAAADSKTFAIRTVKVDGTGDAVLYTPTTMHQINDLRVAGDTIYFLESERLTNGSEETRIYSMPVAGGAPQLVAFHADPEIIGDHDRLDTIAAIDATSLYVVRGLTLGAIVWRVARVGGAETLVFRGPVSSSPQVVGDSLYLRSGNTGVSGLYSISKLPVASTSTVATPIGDAACKGDLVAGDFGLLCTGSRQTNKTSQLSKWGLDGTNHTVLFDPGDKASRETQIGPVVDGFVYVAPDGSNTSHDEISKVPLAGGPPTIIACDRAEIPRRGDFESGANEALVAELDMVATPTELVWVENAKPSGQPETTKIYRAPR